MDYRDKLHKNKEFLTTPIGVAFLAAGLMLLSYPVPVLAAASTIEAGSGAVAETKPASVYGTTTVIDSEETETARANWIKEGDDWYYLLPDGSRNRQDLQFDNALYKFNWNGSLKTAQWVPNTGGGAYPVFCYDEETQFLFDQLNDEKRDLYFEEYPDREEDYSVEAALVNGYSGDAIPGDGTLKNYLEKISYRKNSSCRELYLRGREDADDAFDKLIGKTQDKYDSSGKRKDSLEYYRRIGMAHAEKDGEHYFMVILMR